MVPRFSGQVTLAARCDSRALSVQHSVGRYFDTDGFMSFEAVYLDVVQLIKDFEAGKTDETCEGATGGQKKKKNE